MITPTDVAEKNEFCVGHGASNLMIAYFVMVKKYIYIIYIYGHLSINKSVFFQKYGAKNSIAPRPISQAHQLVKPTLRTILMDHIPPTTLDRLSH